MGDESRLTAKSPSRTSTTAHSVPEPFGLAWIMPAISCLSAFASHLLPSLILILSQRLTSALMYLNTGVRDIFGNVDVVDGAEGGGCLPPEEGLAWAGAMGPLTPTTTPQGRRSLGELHHTVRAHRRCMLACMRRSAHAAQHGMWRQWMFGGGRNSARLWRDQYSSADW